MTNYNFKIIVTELVASEHGRLIKKKIIPQKVQGKKENQHKTCTQKLVLAQKNNIFA